MLECRERVHEVDRRGPQRQRRGVGEDQAHPGGPRPIIETLAGHVGTVRHVLALGEGGEDHSVQQPSSTHVRHCVRGRRACSREFFPRRAASSRSGRIESRPAAGTRCASGHSARRAEEIGPGRPAFECDPCLPSLHLAAEEAPRVLHGRRCNHSRERLQLLKHHEAVGTCSGGFLHQTSNRPPRPVHSSA